MQKKSFSFKKRPSLGGSKVLFSPMNGTRFSMSRPISGERRQLLKTRQFSEKNTFSSKLEKSAPTYLFVSLAALLRLQLKGCEFESLKRK